MDITRDIRYIGVNDYKIDLFEGLYPVPNGMSYNSYVIMDEKIAIMDTVDEQFTIEWMNNIKMILGDKSPDYLIVQHMEPDHSANILKLLDEYPKTTIVATAKAFGMMKNYFGKDFEENRIIVDDKDMLKLGKHHLMFMPAPMVHWPEVLVTYDCTDKILFSADAFGRFGALDADINWIDEARRYYFGIVGKYGLWVQKLLKKLEDMEIEAICPLHGPILLEDIMYYVKIYNIWSSYKPEENGILIAYTSVYGNTKKAIKVLEEKLKLKGCKNIVVRDLVRCDMTEVVSEAFRYNKLVLATTTYNAEIFPRMREYINCLTERFFGNRVVAIIENGSWAPIAAKLIKEKFEKSKDIIYTDTIVRIVSCLNEDSLEQIERLAEELSRNYEFA